MNKQAQVEVLVPQLIELAKEAWAKDDPNIVIRALYPLQAQRWELNELIGLLVTALARCAGEQQ